MLTFPKIVALSIIQGFTELLPVSSSAHVIVAEKLMGLNPTAPAMTFLLVMLHTGTMLAVIVFFGKSWKAHCRTSSEALKTGIQMILAATLATAFVGLILKVVIEKVVFKGTPHAEIEMLFGNLPLIATALAAVGVLILWAGYTEQRSKRLNAVLDIKSACLIGLVQGLCLPLRGFSRSGATISTGLVLGIDKKKLEDFSFALAVVLTPPILLRETLRFFKEQHALKHHAMHHGSSAIGFLLPGFLGMGLSFIAGILALKWLSKWLVEGRWYLFGIYCLAAALVIIFLHTQGL